MSTSIANVTWPFVSGSTNTLVQYKVSTDTVWVTPGSPANPTTNNFYPLTITNNINYDVRLTTNGLTCSPKSTTLQIQSTGTNCCPATYILSADSSYCYKNVDTAATPPSSSENTVAAPYFNYGAYGSVIYSPGYDIGGFGPFTLISLSNTFWNNATESFALGPNNRTALWATTTTDSQQVGFTVCITAPVSGTYYVGCFGDNYIQILADGVYVVSMNVTNMAAYFQANGYPGIGPSVTFYLWHIYPVVLTAGTHVIEIIGNNVVGPAAMGAEIYNATSAQIQSATSYVDLGAELIFSTKDFIGQPVQIGSGGIGYSCPAGSSLVLCSGPAFCRQVLTTSIISC